MSADQNNSLEWLISNDSMMFEKAVPGEKIEKERDFSLMNESDYRTRKIAENSLEEVFSSEYKIFKQTSEDGEIIFRERNEFYIPKLLNTQNQEYGWRSVIEVHKKTLAGITVKRLIKNCQQLLESSISSTSISEIKRKYKIVSEFCAFPMKIREKIAYKKINFYKEIMEDSFYHSYQKQNIRSSYKSDEQEETNEYKINSESWCDWFPSNYTVGISTTTIDEINFVRNCYPNFK
ncbi:hypothetical protein [Candidatus Mycoplasma haematohominis]|nr:hypothetical protein [Candidatus Mycoplasma haemohominis]